MYLSALSFYLHIHVPLISFFMWTRAYLCQANMCTYISKHTWELGWKEYIKMHIIYEHTRTHTYRHLNTHNPFLSVFLCTYIHLYVHGGAGLDWVYTNLYYIPTHTHALIFVDIHTCKLSRSLSPSIHPYKYINIYIHVWTAVNDTEEKMWRTEIIPVCIYVHMILNNHI